MITVSISASFSDTEGSTVSVRGVVDRKTFNKTITIVAETPAFTVDSQTLAEALKTVVDFQASQVIPAEIPVHVVPGES